MIFINIFPIFQIKVLRYFFLTTPPSYPGDNIFVTTPTQPQLNSTKVGFDTKITEHHPP